MGVLLIYLAIQIRSVGGALGTPWDDLSMGSDITIFVIRSKQAENEIQFHI